MISKAFNSSDLEYLTKPELHQHIGKIFTPGDYVVACRTIHPHWFEGTDKTNYFQNQYLDFSTYDRESENPFVDHGFYQVFWDNPVWYKPYPVFLEEDTTTQIPCALFEIVIPLQAHATLDRERVEYYKHEMTYSGLIPTVLVLSMIDDRKLCTSPRIRDNPYPKKIRKYDHLAVATSFIIDGHHKMAAAAELNLPVHVLQYIHTNPYGKSEYHGWVRPEILEKIITLTSPSRLSDTPVVYVPDNSTEIPIIKLFQLPGSLSMLHDPEKFAESLQARLYSLYTIVWNEDKKDLTTREVDLSFFVKHLMIDGVNCYVWPTEWKLFYLIRPMGYAITPQAIADGLFPGENPKLPEYERDYYVPGCDPVPIGGQQCSIRGRGRLERRSFGPSLVGTRVNTGDDDEQLRSTRGTQHQRGSERGGRGPRGYSRGSYSRGGLW